MRGFERLSIPAKTFLISLMCCVALPYWSPFPSPLWKYPVIISIIGFGLLRLFAATKKAIFKTLYLPWMIFASGFLLRSHGRMYPLQEKWILGAHFVALIICSSALLGLINSRQVYLPD